jgi:hypothetical protein
MVLSPSSEDSTRTLTSSDKAGEFDPALILRLCSFARNRVISSKWTSATGPSKRRCGKRINAFWASGRLLGNCRSAFSPFGAASTSGRALSH